MYGYHPPQKRDAQSQLESCGEQEGDECRQSNLECPSRITAVMKHLSKESSQKRSCNNPKRSHEKHSQYHASQSATLSPSRAAATGSKPCRHQIVKNRHHHSKHTCQRQFNSIRTRGSKP